MVEGVTEFLPISSTGHLVLVSQLLGLGQTDFQKTFEIVIQLGAVLSVVYLYWKAFLDIEILKKIAVAFVPTGLVGFALYGVIKTYFLESSAVVLGALLLGGVALVVFEWLHTEGESAVEDIKKMSYPQAALIGLFQSVAVVPGVSRSAATIVGGLLLGVRRVTVVEFSFLLAVPTMLAASGFDLFKNVAHFSAGDAGMLGVGFMVSFVVALLSIKWLLLFVRNHSFVSFGLYRIVVAGLFFLLVLR